MSKRTFCDVPNHKTATTPIATPRRLPSPATKLGATALDVVVKTVSVAVETVPEVVFVGTTRTSLLVLGMPVGGGNAKTVLISVVKDMLVANTCESVIVTVVCHAEFVEVVDVVVVSPKPNPALAARLVIVRGEPVFQTGEISEKVERVGRCWRGAVIDGRTTSVRSLASRWGSAGRARVAEVMAKKSRETRAKNRKVMLMALRLVEFGM